jgi:hypothetical protein
LNQVTGTEFKREVPPHAQDDDLVIEVPSLEEILCRARFDHAGPYRRGSGANFKNGRCADSVALAEMASVACQMGPKMEICTRTFRNTFALRLEFPQGADQGANVVENPEVAHFPADRCHTSVKGVLAVGCINKKGWRPKLAKSRVRTC